MQIIMQLTILVTQLIALILQSFHSIYSNQNIYQLYLCNIQFSHFNEAGDSSFHVVNFWGNL